VQFASMSTRPAPTRSPPRSRPPGPSAPRSPAAARQRSLQRRIDRDAGGRHASPSPSASATPTASIAATVGLRELHHLATPERQQHGQRAGMSGRVRGAPRAHDDHATGSTGVTVTTTPNSIIDLFAYSRPSTTYRVVRSAEVGGDRHRSVPRHAADEHPPVRPAARLRAGPVGGAQRPDAAEPERRPQRTSARTPSAARRSRPGRTA
jgi:hypothetical protein